MPSSLLCCFLLFGAIFFESQVRIIVLQLKTRPVHLSHSSGCQQIPAELLLYFQPYHRSLGRGALKALCSGCKI